MDEFVSVVFEFLLCYCDLVNGCMFLSEFASWFSKLSDANGRAYGIFRGSFEVKIEFVCGEFCFIVVVSCEVNKIKVKLCVVCVKC